MSAFGKCWKPIGRQDLPRRAASRFQGQNRICSRSRSATTGSGHSQRCHFQIEPGQVAAFVGRLGRQDNIINLIARFYDPVSAGKSKLMGPTFGPSPSSRFRQQISFVLQDTLLFRTPVWENIAYGRPEATRAEIIGPPNWPTPMSSSNKCLKATTRWSATWRDAFRWPAPTHRHCACSHPRCSHLFWMNPPRGSMQIPSNCIRSPLTSDGRQNVDRNSPSPCDDPARRCHLRSQKTIPLWSAGLMTNCWRPGASMRNSTKSSFGRRTT